MDDYQENSFVFKDTEDRRHGQNFLLQSSLNQYLQVNSELTAVEISP
jgi:hypothetical protein